VVKGARTFTTKVEYISGDGDTVVDPVNPARNELQDAHHVKEYGGIVCGNCI
jgi:hypothetical protein